LKPDELVTGVTFPAATRVAAATELRPRAAIDFPMLSIAVAARGASRISGCASS
jgi:CO/xanthine dehydrogenase FAD-binding subunit